MLLLPHLIVFFGDIDVDAAAEADSSAAAALALCLLIGFSVKLILLQNLEEALSALLPESIDRLESERVKL